MLPTDHEYVLPAYRNDIGGTGDLLMAVKLMQAAGFHLDNGGSWASASGNVVSLEHRGRRRQPVVRRRLRGRQTT